MRRWKVITLYVTPAAREYTLLTSTTITVVASVYMCEKYSRNASNFVMSFIYTAYYTVCYALHLTEKIIYTAYYTVYYALHLTEKINFRGITNICQVTRKQNAELKTGYFY
jgi:hypothetical protein